MAKTDKTIIETDSTKVIVEISSTVTVLEYLQCIGFLLSLVEEQHFEEPFSGEEFSLSYGITHIHNAGRLIQDLTDGIYKQVLQSMEVKENA